MIFFAVGALMALISLCMAIAPARFADAVLAFSQWRWFHAFEVLSRLSIGAAFVVVSDTFVYPAFATGLGYLLISVGLGLVLLGRTRHECFARWTATLSTAVFRPAGLLGFVLGALLAYLALTDV